VRVPDTGSGYGGKHSAEVAIEAARLAKAAGTPVKLVWTREEELTWAYFRPAGVMRLRSGVDAKGRIAAWEHVNFNSGSSSLATPYDVPERRHVFQPCASPARQGSYRALAATANTFARESHMDEIAARLRVDPLELRRRHLVDARLRAVLDAAADRFGWAARPREPGKGAGLAIGVEKGGYVCTVAAVEVGAARELQVARVVTAFECGAIVNPDNLRNQVEGAVVMGLGGALFEAIELAGGSVANASLSRYRVPRFDDMPRLETVLLDRRDLPPAGAGETPIVAIAPAIANAVFAATGERIRDLPLAPGGRLRKA
jgi:isoquinoline 1-oxidoreductase